MAKHNKIRWTEDEERNDVTIWLGAFKNKADLDRYAAGRFCKELGLPLGDDFTQGYLDTSFSEDPKTLADILREIPYWESFLKPLQKKVTKKSIATYNSAICVFDHRSEDDLEAATSRCKFISRMTYDPSSDESPDYVDEARLSVWCGTFSSRDEFFRYFSLPDHVNPDEDSEYLNDLQEDFQIPRYEPDFSAWVSSRAMKPKPFKDLLRQMDLYPKLESSISRMPKTDMVCNAIYIAFKFDYDKILPGLKKAPKSRLGVQFVGACDGTIRPKK